MGFGSSKSKSQSSSQQTSDSYNQSYDFLKNSLGSQVGFAGKGTSALADLLGLNGAGAQTTGFDNFRDSSGYNFIRDEGMRGINSNNAARGLLGSGSALKAIAGYNNNLASTFLDKYMAQLTGISNQGNTAAQIISGAGNKSHSQGTSQSTGKSSSTNISLG